jgi:hypothetical protein
LIVLPFAIGMLTLEEGRKAIRRSDRGVFAIGSVRTAAANREL